MLDNVHFLYHGKLDLQFTIDEIKNMRIGKTPDNFQYWHTCHPVEPSVTLPFGCIYRQMSLVHFYLLFTDGTFFIHGCGDQSEETHLGFIHWWQEGIIKWRELAKSHKTEQLKIASLPDNNADYPANNGSAAE